MIAKRFLYILIYSLLAFHPEQLLSQKFTRSDTLRGTLLPERIWWDVKKYQIRITPSIEEKTVQGVVSIIYQESPRHKGIMQIDLQSPMKIDSVAFEHQARNFSKIDKNAWHVFLPERLEPKKRTSKNRYDTVHIYFSGKPREAIRAPWDGGWIWKKDEKGRPWVSLACQGLGASVWLPCKDHQSDEPELGMSLTVITPKELSVVANGRKTQENSFKNLKSTTWEVKNPINLYNIVPYIGHYTSFKDTLIGEKGKLDISYWVLDYNLSKAKLQFNQTKPMLRAFEYWFGPYPFYEDGYQLVESPHLGMEHQSAIAYGNQFQNGYMGRDLSGTGWGKKWDFILIHESGHEWYGNNISTKDIADMWVHESFTNYSETLYTEYMFGKQAGDEYVFGLRKNIQLDAPMVGAYGVNKSGSGSDIYYKGSNMIHTIRQVMNNDELFRKMLREMNQVFGKKTITGQDIEHFITSYSGFDFSDFFDQYLRTTNIPILHIEKKVADSSMTFYWTNCSDEFSIPIHLSDSNNHFTFKPQKDPISIKLNKIQWEMIRPEAIELKYYINVKQSVN